MADFEMFQPSEAGESYDPAAFERFKQQMKASGAKIAQAQKDEAKQKQKEDKLALILLKLIKGNQKRGILFLAARLLEENIPPSFILAIIILGNEDILAEVRTELGSLPAPENKEPLQGRSEYALITQFADETIPLQIKIKLDEWGKSMWDAASVQPFRILETIVDREGNIKRVVIDCTANVLDDFLKSSGMLEATFETNFSFCQFLLQGIAKQLRSQIEGQKQLGGTVE